MRSLSLPAELWREIFRIATLDPRMPDLSSTAISPLRETILGRRTYEERATEREELLQKVQKAKDTKCAVSVVCKSWRAMTIGYLFEHLTLNFRCPQYKLPNGPPPPSLKGPSGALRKVLSITAIYERGRRRKTSMRSYQPFISFLRFCPNLVIMSGELPRGPLEMVSTIISKCGLSLRDLRFLDLDHISPSEWDPVLNTLPNLERLDLTNIHVTQRNGAPDIVLPSLHTLSMNGWYSDQKWDVPRLVRLDWSDKEPTNDFPILRAFSESIRSGVKMLTLHSGTYPILNAAYGFPNVEILRFPIPQKLALWTQSSGRFTLVQEIGLTTYVISMLEAMMYDSDEDGPRDSSAQLKAAAFTLLLDRHRFPSLKLIRCCDFEPPIREPWWLDFMQESIALEIRVEDKRGTAIFLE